MLGHKYPRRGFRRINYGGRPSSTTGTDVPAGVSAHVLSTNFVELVSALAYPIRWITITISGSALNATQTDALLSLYIGGAGSEQFWIRNLLAGWSGQIGYDSAIPKVYEFPLYLPAGTRISAKSQALVPGQQCRVWLEYSSDWNADGWAGSGVQPCGVSSVANSRGTAVTPGTTSEGSWTSLGTVGGGFTGWNYGFVLPMIQGTMTNTATPLAMYHLDIGTAGAVIEGLDDFAMFASSSETVSQCSPTGKFIGLGAGTPLQVRVQTSGTDVSPVDAAIYGVF